MEMTDTPKRSRFIYYFFGVLAVLMVLWIVFTVFSGNEWATIQQGDSQAYMVRVADNPLERTRGLAGSASSDLGDAVGMVFVYNDEAPRKYTMKGMNYALDFMWLKDGRIVKIDLGVPAPEAGEEPETVSTYPLDVDMVIEVPAGTVAELQYLVGHELTVNLNP